MNNEDYMMSEMIEQILISDFYSKNLVINENGLISNLDNLDIDKIIFTGCGDSFCAAWYGSELFNRLNTKNTFFSCHFQPFNLNSYYSNKITNKTLIVGISVSGNTPRIVESFKLSQKKKCHFLAITDNPQGKLFEKSKHKILTHASPPDELLSTQYESQEAQQYVGYHHDVAQTKTYFSNLLALTQFVYAFNGHSNPLKDIKKYITNAIEISKQIGEMIPIFADLNRYTFTGSGLNRSNAKFGEYKMCEFIQNGFSNDIEDFAHTQYFISDENSLVAFIGSDTKSNRRISEIEPVLRNRINVKTLSFMNERVGDSEYQFIFDLPSDKLLSPLIYSIPVEFLSYYIAKSKKLDTNKFRAGVDTEKYVSGSLNTIRKSKLNF